MACHSATTAGGPRSPGLEPPEALLRECLAIASRLRQLEPRRKPPARVEEVAVLEAGIARDVDQALPADRLERWRLELSAFGFVPGDFDLRGYLKALYAEQLAAYYDPGRGRLVLVDRGAAQPSPSDSVTTGGAAGDLTTDGAAADTYARRLEALEARGITLGRVFLVHELVHSLQDQRLVPLATFLAPSADTDGLMARRALVEGDASFVMTQYLLGEDVDLTLYDDVATHALSAVGSGLVPGTAVLTGGPRFFRDRLLFSYYYGLDFVIRLLREGGWSMVNRAYAAPPRSTEQILHPGRYIDGVLPDRIDLGELQALPSRGYRTVAEGTLGELGVRIWLAGTIGDDTAARAATGWGGDRYRVYQGPSGALVVWATSWDDEAEAREFEAALVTHRARWSMRPGAFEVHRNGRLNLMAWGPAQGLEAVSSALASEVRVEAVPPVPPGFFEPVGD